MAQPSTLTGSIGVFGGKFALGDALSRFGVDTRQVTVGGDYAGAFGTGQEFTADQRAQAGLAQLTPDNVAVIDGLVRMDVAASKFKDFADFGTKINGHIMLTYHQDECWYRNIKLRELK